MIRRPHVRRRTGSLLVALAGAAFALLVPAAPAYADGPTVTGAGSTFSQIAIDQWRADVSAKYGLSINYSGVGSSAGRQFYVGNQVDFAASEIPFQPDELSKLHAQGKSFQYSPIVAGATSLMYNLKDASGQRVVNLKLDSKTVGSIFTGKITSWTDPAIKALNPGLDLSSNGNITPVIRSDGSGTSAQFTAYMRSQDYADWGPFAKAQQNGDDSATSNYPNFGDAYAAKGSDGVANYVQQNTGAICYVETGYAIERNFPVASMKNASGAFTQPTSANVSTALAKATLNPDHTQNLDGVYTNAAPTAYPISSYSYFIVPTSGFNAAKGRVLGAFMIYFACAGQQKAAPLGYSPLPPNLVQTVFTVIRQIPGAPAPPPLSECANPTIAGARDGGVPLPAASSAPAAGAASPSPGSAPSASASASASPVPGAVLPSAAIAGPAVGAPPAVAAPAVAAQPAAPAAASPSYAADQVVALTVTSGSGSSAALPGILLLLVVLGPPLLLLPGQRLYRRWRAGRDAPPVLPME